MTKYFGRERLGKGRVFRLSPQCGDTTSCIKHLVSDRRLLLISKENLHMLDKYLLHIYSVLIQNCVSGRACCVNQYSLRVAKATSCDAVSSRNTQDLINNIVPTHYACNKFI